MKLLEVGKIVATHGIKGEVKVKVITDNLKRFSKDNILYIDNINKELPKEKIVITNFRNLPDKKDMILLSFNNINDINNVLKYVNKIIYVDIDANREDNEIYFDDLIDCKVLVKEENIGIVIDVMEVPQGQILRIKKNNGKMALVPYVEEFIENVDLENKIIVINPIEGLL